MTGVNNAINSPIPTTVANGGTGNTSLTAYAPVFGGTTSTGAIQSGTVGTINQILMSAGAGAIPAMQWPNQPNRYSITRAFDFMLGSTPSTSDTSGTSNASGTGSAITTGSNISTSGNVIGVSAIATGTTTTGAAGLALVGNANSANFPFYIGGATITLEFCLYGVSALSNGTDTYIISAGFGSITGITDTAPTTGIFFTYTDSANSGNWVGNCNNGSNASTNGSIGPTITSAQTLKIIINSAGNSVSFYINDALMGSAVTSDIPTTIALLPFINIIKSAGTTSRTLYVDAARYELDFTSTR